MATLKPSEKKGGSQPTTIVVPAHSRRRTDGKQRPVIDLVDVKQAEKKRKERKALERLDPHRQNKKHKLASRIVAKRLWDQKGDALTLKAIPFRFEIIEACEGVVYAPTTIRRWVKDLNPNRKPGRRPNKK